MCHGVSQHMHSKPGNATISSTLHWSHSMDHFDPSSRQINAALFVDFDNVYISLANQDRQVANQFAANPEGWLNWLEEYLPSPQLGVEQARRRILIRRCYLNPQSFSNYRPFFIRSAF